MGEDDVGRLYPVAKAILTPIFRASWRFDVRGLDNVPASGGAILCPNHTSVLDSFFVPTVLPRRVTYVGKAEYLDDWKTRTLFPALGMIPIDRTGGDAAERALATAQRILERGELFGIYPEGTRSRDGRLYRGKTGPARLALRSGAPIVPIGIRGAREVMPPDARFPRLRLPVTIEFGRPVDVSRYTDRVNDHLLLRQITDEVMFAIRELSGQEYIDEYASKKASAPDIAPVRTPAVDVRVPVGVGAGSGSFPRAEHADVAELGRGRTDPSAATTGVDGREGADDLFVGATEPRSSADLLRPPARRAV